MPSPITTAVVGVTGYAGFELARLLARHPRVKPPLLMTRESSESSADLAELYPQIAPANGNGQGHPLEPFSWSRLKSAGVDLLFLSTPHEVSRAWIPQALSLGLRVVDLSAAWRLRQPEHQKVYDFEDSDPQEAARLAGKAVYGLCELNRGRLAEAQLVANPGCYPTSIILALAPLLKAGLVDLDKGIVCDSKSGVSGAGKQPTAKTHFVEVAENLSAYSVFAHRHTGEILEQLGLQPEQLTFVPHLLPIPRGILSTIYVQFRERMPEGAVLNCFHDFYRGCAFVRLFTPPRLPQIQYSVRTNYCDIGFTLAPDGRRLVVVSCLDNLMKGAAGQAVQNMNLMFGWNEQEGLA
jgi:N-acetyl-gamma-glutamyl-phosphate reductase